LRRSELGLDLDLVATKHWLAPTGLLRVPSLLKPAVRGEFQAVVFPAVTFLKLVSFAGRTFRCI
jgi:hypothetical protein